MPTINTRGRGEWAKLAGVGTFFGYKVLMVAVSMIPFTIGIYLLVTSLGNGTTLDVDYYQAGLRFQQDGRLNDAIAQYDQAIKLNPMHLQAYNQRASAYLSLGDLGQALQDFNQAISQRSQLVDIVRTMNVPELLEAIAQAYVGQALVYTMQGKDTEAQRSVGKGVDLGYDLALALQAINEIKTRR